jgi:uncharacterized protein YjiS (DUF1127 family)
MSALRQSDELPRLNDQLLSDIGLSRDQLLWETRGGSWLIRSNGCKTISDTA